MLFLDDKIKTTRDQVTTQSNIPVSNFVLLKRNISVSWLLLLNMKCRYYYYYYCFIYK